MPQKLQVFLIMKNFYFDLYDISEDIKERLKVCKWFLLLLNELCVNIAVI